MSQPKILHVTFEGINGSGKTTQIEHVARYLTATGIPVLLAKGDGARPGTGSSELDPPSDWWQARYQGLYEMSVYSEEASRLGREASDRLQAELAHRLAESRHCLTLLGCVLLEDRGILSRLFVQQRYSPDCGLNHAQIYTDLQGATRILSLPDIMIFLLVSRDEAMYRIQ